MEIEFIEHPAEDVVPARSDGCGRGDARRWLDLAPVPLFVAAAVLAVVAPFQRFYLIGVTSGGFRQTVTYDGWGRFAISPAFRGPFGEHGARYGVVAVVLAGLAALAAAGWTVAAVRELPGPARGALAGAGGAVTAALGACAAMAWLEASAAIDSTRRLTRPEVGRTLEDRISIRAEYGGFLWLLLGATACGAVGTVLLVRAALRPRRGEAPLPAAEPYPTQPHAFEPGEELSW